MGKALTEKQYYILRKQGTERPFKMNLMTTIKRVIIFVQPASCLCLILKQNSIQERMA
jgi:peptide methionine sulfoxide reductase MsrB